MASVNKTITIPMDILPESFPSVFIPRIFTNVEWWRVKSAFESVGEVERVDLKTYTHKDGVEYNRGYIHFKSWKNIGNAVEMRESLLNGNTLKVTYEENGEKKRYWLVTMSTLKKPMVKQANQPRHKVDLTESVTKIFQSVTKKERLPKVDSEYAGGATPEWTPSSPPFEVGKEGEEEISELTL